MSQILDVVDAKEGVVGSGESVSHNVGLALQISDISRVLRDAAELVHLTKRLRVRLLVDGRDKALMVRK